MPAAAPQQLDRMIAGSCISQAIYAAARFDVAGLLSAGPKSVAELAEATSTHPDALYRLLRALASAGVFAEISPRRFALTPLAELLRDDVPGSKRDLSLMMGDEQFRAFAEIDQGVRTGKTVFEKIYGMPVFDYLAEHPEKARIFDRAMVGIHGRDPEAILAAYDFSGVGVVADVGGGNGSQITALLQKYPAARGILFDLPHVIERARPSIEAAGLADRCELVGGSFFERVPAGADVYLLRHIIHDWDEAKVLAILRTCRAAMKPDSKLLIVESVIPEGNAPCVGKLLDLVLLLVGGGRERTAGEYRDLLARAGFELRQVVPTETEVSVIEATIAIV
mgnify:CR=1 FL=1